MKQDPSRDEYARAKTTAIVLSAILISPHLVPWLGVTLSVACAVLAILIDLNKPSD